MVLSSPTKAKVRKSAPQPLSKKKIDVPEQWNGLYGDISQDPIAQSLMKRLEAGTLDASVPTSDKQIMFPKKSKTMRTITIDSCLEVEALQPLKQQTLKKTKSYQQPKVGKMDIPS